MSLDFDQACIFIAAFLAATAVKRYRLICFIIFLNFVAHEMVSRPILHYLDGSDSWPLHAVYVLIGGTTFMTLARIGCTRFLYWSIFIFSVYNLIIISEFMWINFGFHNNFVKVARYQMAIELLSMLIMNQGSRYVWTKLNTDRSYVYAVDRLFVNRFRLGFERSI